MQNILGNIRKAIQDYNMIEDGDKIAIGLSGGKDSITLLYALCNLQKFFPKKFELVAITISPGFDEFDTSYLTKICNELNIKYIVQNSNIKEIVFDIREEKNPCSLCANLRRGILNSVAKENGCNKIALGHHADDVLETFFLSLLYEGHIHTFSPVTYLNRIDITSIRPMIYVNESDIIKWIKESNIKPIKKCCAIDGFTKREDMKELIKTFSKKIPHVRSNIYGAIKRSKIKGWNSNNLLKEDLNED